MEASEKISVLAFISILFWTALRPFDKLRAQGTALEGVAEAELAFEGLKVGGNCFGRKDKTAQVKLESC